MSVACMLIRFYFGNEGLECFNFCCFMGNGFSVVRGK